jgi:hypothetical protein
LDKSKFRTNSSSSKPPTEIGELLAIVDRKVSDEIDKSEKELEIYERKHRFCEEIYNMYGEKAASEAVQDYFEVLATKYPDNPKGGLTLDEFKQASKGFK